MLRLYNRQAGFFYWVNEKTTLYQVAYGPKGTKSKDPVFCQTADRIIESQKRTKLLGTVMLVAAGIILAVGISLVLTYSCSPAHMQSAIAHRVVNMGAGISALGCFITAVGIYLFYQSTHALNRYKTKPVVENLRLLGRDLEAQRPDSKKLAENDPLLLDWEELYQAYAPHLDMPDASREETLRAVAYDTCDGEIVVKNPAAAQIISQHQKIICIAKVITCVSLIIISISLTAAVVFFLATHLNALSLAQAGGCFGLAGCVPLVLGGISWYKSRRALIEYETKPMEHIIDRINKDLLKISSKDAFEAEALREGAKMISQALELEDGEEG